MGKGNNQASVIDSKELKEEKIEVMSEDTTEGVNVDLAPTGASTEPLPQEPVPPTEEEIVAEENPAVLEEETPEEPPQLPVEEVPIEEPIPVEPEVVPMPEPLPEDFPIHYEIRNEIVDPFNEDSLVNFHVTLLGPDGEDFGTRTVTQSLGGIHEDSIDAQAEVLAQEMATALQASKHFKQLQKAAPKREKKADSSGENHDEESIDYTITLEALADDLKDVKKSLKDVKEGQEAIIAWLSQLYTVLTS